MGLNNSCMGSRHYLLMNHRVGIILRWELRHLLLSRNAYSIGNEINNKEVEWNVKLRK